MVGLHFKTLKKKRQTSVEQTFCSEYTRWTNRGKQPFGKKMDVETLTL